MLQTFRHILFIYCCHDILPYICSYVNQNNQTHLFKDKREDGIIVACIMKSSIECFGQKPYIEKDEYGF